MGVECSISPVRSVCIRMAFVIGFMFNLFVVSFSAAETLAAGCVASRGAGIPLNKFSYTPMDTSFLETKPPLNESEKDNSADKSEGNNSSDFQATVAYRSFRSDRHFVGEEEQKERQHEGSEVINNSRFIDVSFDYSFDDVYNASLTIPFAYHDRSQVVRDSNRTILQRFHTQSAGFGDLQVLGSKLLFDPKVARKGNTTIGLGVDIPTGQDDIEDTFMVYDAASKKIVAETRTVDQSIQLSDGGWGAILYVNTFYNFFPQVTGFFDATYTITPEEKNGVRTFRSNPFEAEMSIADNYLARAGMSYVVLPKHNLTLSLSARMEGVRVHDLVGGSDGFRRPGYDISIEPGISMNIESWLFNLYVPISIERNRQRSVPDRQQSAATGRYSHGDAAFADYSVTFAVTKRY